MKARRAASKLTLAFSLALVLILAPGTQTRIQAQAWDASLPASLDKLTADYFQPSLQTAFGTFTYAYTDLPTTFSRWFEESLAGAISKTKNLKLFNRAAAAAMDPAFKAIYEDFFKNNAVDGLLYGRYFEEGEVVRAHVELTGLSDGSLIGSLDLVIPRRALPGGVNVAPAPPAVAMAADLTNIVGPGLAAEASTASLASAPGAPPATPSPNALSVSVSTERGAGAVYRQGEDMVVLVTVSKPAYLKVYHIDVNGVLQLIWPNRFHAGNRIEPGRVVRIPAEDDGFAFRMTPPFGTEFIKVIASTRPFASNESDFISLGQDARGAIARGLSVIGVEDSASVPSPLAKGFSASAAGGASSANELAEAQASYLIMEALR